jgi:hypothetical protein
MLNSTKDQDIEKFKKIAKSFHANWLASLGKFKTLTATVHLILAHGHLYIKYAQTELKCPNGWLSESSIEGANKLNRFLRFFLSRKNSLRNERTDMMVRHLWMSDPHVIACYALQVRAIGRIRISKKKKNTNKTVMQLSESL